ncbi:MAG: hypothetical protein FJ077_16470 [Cyanobacteria bacterium K_DeepCast_35m_m2_023]|nr:hypothetical protein [Cyanobacteria bacterium K_DeepCast_35m_m2_023]
MLALLRSFIAADQQAWFWAEHHRLQLGDLGGLLGRHLLDVQQCFGDCRLSWIGSDHPQAFGIGLQQWRQDLIEARQADGGKAQRFGQLGLEAISLASGDVFGSRNRHGSQIGLRALAINRGLDDGRLTFVVNRHQHQYRVELFADLGFR